MATPVILSSDILQRKYCVRTLLLKYHPKGQKEASYNSEMPENHIFFFEDRYSEKTEFYFRGLDLQYRTPEIGLSSCEIEKDNFRDSQGKQIRTESKESFECTLLRQ